MNVGMSWDQSVCASYNVLADLYMYLQVLPCSLYMYRACVFIDNAASIFHSIASSACLSFTNLLYHKLCLSLIHSFVFSTKALLRSLTGLPSRA